MMGKGKKVLLCILYCQSRQLFSVFPLYYMFCAATNKSVDVIAGKLIPGTYLIENYKALIANQNLGLALWNSFRNATVLTVLCLLICSIAGYGFEIYHDKGKDVVIYHPADCYDDSFCSHHDSDVPYVLYFENGKYHGQRSCFHPLQLRL